MYFEGRTQSAIARETGIPLGTVKSRTLLGMRRLRKELEGIDVEVDRVSERPIHDRLEELFAADAMGGLDDDGRHELHELLTWHDAQCPDCARLRPDYGEVAAAMALSLDPMPMSAGAEERLLTATRTTTQGRRRAVAGPARSWSWTRRGRSANAGAARAKVAVALLTAAACLVGAGVIGYALRTPTTSPEAVVAAYTSQGPTQQATMQDGSKKVTLYYHPGQPQALVVGSGMDDPPAGHVYELWYLPAGQTDMAPGGIFVPSDGDVVAPATVETPFTTLAVSIEPGYHTAPAGEVVLTARSRPEIAPGSSWEPDGAHRVLAGLAGLPDLLGRRASGPFEVTNVNLVGASSGGRSSTMSWTWNPLRRRSLIQSP